MKQRPHIAAIIGLEQYNAGLWNRVRQRLQHEAELSWISDQDLARQTQESATAIRDCDCVFMSMINFSEQIDWFRQQLEAATNDKTLFIFESMPEAMALTKVGGYKMGGDGKAGMPDIVRKVARLLVKGRDEDALYGYMKLMNIMRTLLPVLPEKAKDFRNWFTVYSYWMQPTEDNVVNMFRFILREYYRQPIDVAPVAEVPGMGLYHPEAGSYFTDMKSFKNWQKRRGIVMEKKQSVGLLFFRKHLLQEKTYIDNTIRMLEKQGIALYPAFVMGVEGHVLVRDWFIREKIDLLVNMMGFGLVGGPAGSTSPGIAAEARHDILTRLNVPYMVSQPLLTQGYDSWKEQGVSPMQVTFTYSIPEMDGAIAPVITGALDDGRVQSDPERLERLATLIRQWLRLRATSNADKHIALIVYDYPPGLGKKASAALLDVPATLLAILRRLQQEGYQTGPLPESPESLFRLLDRATDYELMQADGERLLMTRDQYRQLVSGKEQERIEERWNSFPGDIVPMGENGLFVGGIRFGNIFIGVQPRIGVQGDPMRLLFDRSNTPHHQYISFYRWIARTFAAHALVHIGMHGSAEWMPGLQTGLRGDCWPDALLGEVPHLYLYPVNNPSESTIAKRRGLATMISHVVPPLSRAGLYKELPALREMLADYRDRTFTSAQTAAGSGNDTGAEESIMQKAAQLNLTDDCARIEGEPFSSYASRLYSYLTELESRLITNALHLFGQAPQPEEQLVTLVETLKNRQEEGRSLAGILLRLHGNAEGFTSHEQLIAAARRGDETAIRIREWLDHVSREFIRQLLIEGQGMQHSLQSIVAGAHPAPEELEFLNRLHTDGTALLQALRDNSGEMEGLILALNGRYLPSGPGGDLIRDGITVLPSGRNIHAIDPWRIPSQLAFRRGTIIADTIIRKHHQEQGSYPETIAQVLWGLDTIKTKGEAVAIIIALLGAEPAYDSFGKISHYRLISLTKLGRPRIDVLMQLSPVFRDAFGLLMDLLDRLIQDCATADEPETMNYVKKHVNEALASGMSIESATARQFTQAPGTYGSYVDDMIEDAAWESEEDLDSVFIRRNSSAYGGGRNGAQESATLQHLLGSVDRVVHQVDSVEFGISDIDHYFSSSGSLQLAARRRNSRVSDVRLNYVESFTSDIRVDDVGSLLRMEYRSKLLNPKWYEGMLRHGHGGATEISNRVTYMLGWDAITHSVDDWVYAQTATTYALDPVMRERLAQLNPQAIKNIVGRMLEAHGRGLWHADQQMIDELQNIYADLEDRLENIDETR